MVYSLGSRRQSFTGEIMDRIRMTETTSIKPGPGFQVGERVRVASADRIRQSLDDSDRADGCLPMDQMLRFCGSEFKVLRVVENVFDEHRLKMYRTNSPLYILEGIICDGIIPSFDHRCDRSCYLLWHEDWLENITE